mgnify:CR=1 FL=1
MSKLSLIKFTKPVVMFTRKGLRFIGKNSNLILTIVSATGVVATVACAIHGTIKAVKLCEVKKPVGAKEVVKTVWKCYIPTIGMVLLTTTAIIGNGRINAKKIAVLTSALAGSRESLKALETKMAEEIGPKKAQKVIDAAKSEEAKENLPASSKDIIETGNGNVLFFIKDFGQWIRSSHEGVELAELKTSNELRDANDWTETGENYIPANVALEHLGARNCTLGEYMGWKASDFRGENQKGPKFRISSEWMNVNGKDEIVGTIWFQPSPDYL